MDELKDKGPEYYPVEDAKVVGRKTPTTSSTSSNNSRSSNQLLDLVRRFDKGELVTNEEIISNYVDPEFIQNLMLFNIKVAENGMLNSAKIIHKLESLVDELIERLDDPSGLTSEELTTNLGILFEMQSRYQMVIEKILNEDSYKYYLENLAAVQRLIESRKSSSNYQDDESMSIYDNEVDRKLLHELVTDIKKSLSSTESINEIEVGEGKIE